MISRGVFCFDWVKRKNRALIVIQWRRGSVFSPRLRFPIRSENRMEVVDLESWRRESESDRRIRQLGFEQSRLSADLIL